MEEVKHVKKKLVTVRCPRPFAYKKIPFVGICNRIVLDVDAIKFALGCKAFVVEHLSNGQEVPLGFDNYDTWNGPSEITDDSAILSYIPQEIEMIDGFGNRKIINKRSEKEDKPVIHIDLEAERQKAKEIEKQKKLEQERLLKQQEIERIKQLKEEQKERDRVAREKASAEILAKAQAEADKAAGLPSIEEKKTVVEDSKSTNSLVIDFPISTTTEETITSSDDIKNEDSFSYSKKNKKHK